MSSVGGTPPVVGVDLGGTKTELGLVDPQNRIVARRRMPTRDDEGPEAVVERLASRLDELETALPSGQHIAALGICTPGPVDHAAGSVLDPPNVPGLHNTPLRQLLAERLDLPVSLEHDAKAAALGEFYYGAGRDAQSMVYVVVGTGVGAAIIMDGELIRGEHNYAGEVGHTTLDPDGELCSCGSRGCVETFMSGPWLARRYERAVEPVAPVSSPELQEPVTGELVTRLAAEGDSAAKRIVTEAGVGGTPPALGLAVACMAMILNIDLYVIGGSVAKAGDLLLEPARRTVPQYSFESVGSHVRIVPAERGVDGPILGCAWLARVAVSPPETRTPPAINQGS